MKTSRRNPKQAMLSMIVMGVVLAFVLLIAVEPVHASSFVVTNANDSGAGSLRQAILDANANSGGDTITFAIGTGAQTIKPLSALPQITDSVTIDGTSQPGYAGSPLIELDGGNAGDSADGLEIAADNFSIQGLAIYSFSGDGIRFAGNNNLIAHNYIGTDSAGTFPDGNVGTGILLNSVTSSAGNLIRDNLVLGNGCGILVQGAATGTIIQGNRIGANSTGIGILTNAANTLVGGPNTGDGNVIFSNWSGITTDHPAGVTRIEGNLVGTDATGTNAAGNFGYGIWIRGSSGVIIGGTVYGARNVISGNGSGSYFNASGIYLEESDGVIVQGNFIGTNKDGTAALGNLDFGIVVAGAINSQIGGTDAGAMNVISGNKQLGIYLRYSSTDNTRIEGNRIGTTADGTAKLGNGQNGIYVERATNTVIGGTALGAGNLISGNGLNGIANNFSDMVVQGNLIGTNAAGNTCLGNAGEGIFLGNVATIGGTTQSAANLISCNGSDGIEVCGSNSCPEVPRASRAIEGDFNAKEIPATTPSQVTTTFATIQNN